MSASGGTEAAVPETGFSGVPARVTEDAARADEFRTFRAPARASCWSVSPLTARSTNGCTRGIRDMWTWPDWPEEFRDPDSAATARFRAKTLAPRTVLPVPAVADSISNWREAQAEAVRRGLAHGPVSRPGAGHRPFRLRPVGAPATSSSRAAAWDLRLTISRPKGQDWAFPPPNSQRHWETGYRLFVESIRKNCRHGGMLRIDHVMRFFRLYWIPDGADATAGAYVRDRWEDLIRIVALESVRNQVVVVGEDLGTVEPFVREALARFGILSYRLFYFERDERGEFRPLRGLPAAGAGLFDDARPAHAGGLLEKRGHRSAARAPVCWAARRIIGRNCGRALQRSRRCSTCCSRSHLLPDSMPRSAEAIPELTGELHNAVIGFLASTPSQLMVVNQEDLTKELQQQNLPGTTWQYPNWSRKMRFSMEDLRTERMARDVAAMFRHWVERTTRQS